MKYSGAIILSLATATEAFAFLQPRSLGSGSSSSSLSMVLEKPKAKKLAKIETLKIESDHLVKPLLTVSCFARTKAEDVERNASNEVMQYILSPSDRYMSMAKKGPVPQASGRFG